MSAIVGSSTHHNGTKAHSRRRTHDQRLPPIRSLSGDDGELRYRRSVPDEQSLPLLSGIAGRAQPDGAVLETEYLPRPPSRTHPGMTDRVLMGAEGCQIP